MSYFSEGKEWSKFLDRRRILLRSGRGRPDHICSLTRLLFAQRQVTSTFIEARLSGAEPKKKKQSDSDLSVRSITDVFKLNPKEDLRLVRKGKKLPFGKGTNIMAFLYRTSLKAENDEKEQGKLMQVFGDHTFVEVTLDVAFEVRGD